MAGGTGKNLKVGGKWVKRWNTATKNKSKWTNKVYGKKLTVARPFMVNNSQSVKLRYFDAWNVETGVGTFGEQIFALNSIYDPDETGVGGTPTGAAAWAGLYQKYKVTGAKIRVTANNVDGTVPAMAGYFLTGPGGDKTASSGTDLSQRLTEGKNAWYRLSQAKDQANQMMVFKPQYIDFAKLVGRGYYDEEYSALMGANPSKLINMTFGCCGWFGTETSVAVQFAVQITYYVTFSNPSIATVD